MATFLHRLGLGVFRHRVAVAGVWLLLLVLAGVGALTLSGRTVDTFEIPGQESTEALALIGERFGAGADGATAQVVLADPVAGRIDAGTPAAEVGRVVQELRRLPGVLAATDPLDPEAPAVSADGRAAYSTVTYGVQAPEITEEQRAELLRVVQQARDGGLTAEVTGQASQATSEVGGPTELIGVVAALLVLAVTYGSLVAGG